MADSTDLSATYNDNVSQKPSEELLSTFRRQYTEILPSQDQEIEVSTTQPCQTPNLAFEPNHFQGVSGRNNGLFTSGTFDVSPEWRTSGLLDPTVDEFHDVNQPGGYWPPTPQGSMLYGGAQGDVHAHQAAFGVETPVSGTGTGPAGFPPQPGSFTGHEFMGTQRVDSFTSHQAFGTPPSLPPHALHHTGTSFEPTDVHTQGLHLSDVSLAQEYRQPHAQQLERSASQTTANVGPRFVVDAMNQFRFRTILKAQTAMIKHPQDIPVTYLNKSQTYHIQIEDSSISHGFANPSLKYRTAVRISFEDDHQRKTPTSSWQLWNEGRGTNEAIKRGGRKPKAVEFVGQDQMHPDCRTNIQVMMEHFDGFSVTWSPSADGMASCNLQLRFNFLSTDFSHSKGVKGVAVRLCAKTELIEGQNLLPASPTNREICYCAVKVFRDHGAERKLANDKAHIDKLIEKFTNQAEQAEAGVKEGGKRRRSDSVISSRPSKIAKHKRTWSMSSSGSLEDPQEAAEDELFIRIRSLKVMPESVRPLSAFYLGGDEQDDLDNHPVILPSNSPTLGSPALTGPPSLQTDTTQTSRSTGGLSSETPTSRSPSMMRMKGEPGPPYSNSFEASSTPTLSNKSPIKQELIRPTPQQLASPPSSGPMKAKTIDKTPTSTPAPQLNRALDVDKSYEPPTDARTRAVAEFFMKPSIAGRPPVDDNYRAIYLTERSLNDLVRAVALKCGVDPVCIISTIRVNDQDLPITAEDDMVEQMPERQDFIAELDVANDTHHSAAQFLECQDEPVAGTESVPKYKLTLRY